MYFKTHRKHRSFLQYSERVNQAHKSLQKAPKISSTAENILEKAKKEYYVQKDFKRAIDLFQQHMTVHPQHNQVLYLCGVAHLQVNQSQAAILKLKLVSKDYENHKNAQLMTAIALNKLGCRSKSIQIINSCLRHYSQFQEALCFRGRLQMQMGCFTQAQMDFKKAVELKNASYMGFIGLGDCYRATSYFQKAIQTYKRAQELIKTMKGDSKTDIVAELQLKTAICLYYVQDFARSLKKLYALRHLESMTTSDLYFYIGLCEVKLNRRDEGLLSLEYCIKLQTNPQVMKKAYKRLLRLYLQNNQFYEAMNVIQLGIKCDIHEQQWKSLVQGFMLVIKGQYKKALLSLNESVELLNEKKEKSPSIAVKQANELITLQQPVKLKIYQKKMIFFDSNHQKQPMRIKSKSYRRKSEVYSKSVSKALAKIESTSNYKSTMKLHNQKSLRHNTEHFTSHYAQSSPIREKDTQTIQIIHFNSRQRQILYPLTLKFKAYAQFFEGQYLCCMETYEHYEAFMKQIYGKQSDCNYNKLLCDSMLMLEDQLADQALSKFSDCVEYYFQQYKIIPVEPILYKLSLLVKLAAIKLNEEEESQQEEPDAASSEEILSSTLKMMENYKIAIKQHHLAHFYHAVIFIMKQDYTTAKQCLELTLKLAEECSWLYLYIKGVVQMTLGNYYAAIKEFSAGLILQPRPQLYLGRSISFILLHEGSKGVIDQAGLASLIKSVSISSALVNQEENSQQTKIETNHRGENMLVQYCLSDIQSYIKLASEEVQMAKWVSRLLFATKSYQQALSSIVKLQVDSYEFMQMAQCIQIYDGQYESGGSVGLIIKSAFDGQFLNKAEEKILLQHPIVKNYNDHLYEYMTKDYEKWLVILHLYVKEDYQKLIKYMQRELFNIKEDQQTQLLIRYNMSIVYLLVGETSKAVNLAKSLGKFNKKYPKVIKMSKKMAKFEYQKDECLEELSSTLGIGNQRLLSSFLPFRQVQLMNYNQVKTRVLLRINVPFPEFPLPILELKIDQKFILKHLGFELIEKKIEAPWIRRMDNHMIQFTQHLEESLHDTSDLISEKESISSKMDQYEKEES